ncbi:serine hydrolase domain-containing protein [Streptosporangium sp. NPDC023963]|uniref:serine hydrolase domain-containing protein n=1 Tax=Streptosporangium sp. NPDC023963 TaxID=3155608 RepID=UPI00344288EE
MRRIDTAHRLRGPAVATIAALTLAGWAVPARALPRAAPTPLAPAAPVSAPDVAGAGSFDLVRPSAHPVELRSAPRRLSVTYTYEGDERTFDDFLARTKTNGLVVLDGRRIVAERYVKADRDTRFQSWSMAKSFTSTAIGIALHEGRIRSIDDPVTRYLPELRGSGYDGVSIRNLLRMSSGIAWDERSDVPKLQMAANRGRPVGKLAARQVRGWEPGSRFEYTSMNSFVLAKLVSRATGMPYHRYVEKKIWKPAGMASTVRVDKDSNGDSLGYCCYYATDRDFARFGLLYLREGKAGGRQVVPRSWVRTSTTPSASFNPGYGLHWWLGGDGRGDFMAAGFGGQYIYVSPRQGVVIVKSSLSAPANDRREALTAFRAVAAEVARTR